MLLTFMSEDPKTITRATRLRLGQEMHKILKGSRLEIFEDAAHCPNYEQPEKFNEIVSGFLMS
jgi:pimeloyl-ACP methyl ester carboxylesterase